MGLKSISAKLVGAAASELQMAEVTASDAWTWQTRKQPWFRPAESWCENVRSADTALGCDASRRASGELQINRAATKRAEEAGKIALVRRIAVIHRCKCMQCRACCVKWSASRTSLFALRALLTSCFEQGRGKCGWWRETSRVASRLGPTHDKEEGVSHETCSWGKMLPWLARQQWVTLFGAGRSDLSQAVPKASVQSAGIARQRLSQVT